MSLDPNQSAYKPWSCLLSDLYSLLKDPELRPICKEKDFHKEFLELCINYKLVDRQRWLARFLRLHNQIIAFVGALDDAVGPQDSHTIGSIFWSFAFSITKAALKLAKIQILFKDYLPRLNKTLPTFGAQVSLFPELPLVQEPLQKFFKDYIECYSVMLVQFASQPTDASLQAFDERISSARFHNCKTDWEEMVRKAKEEQRLAHSAPSVPTGSTGPIHPYITKVSLKWMEHLGEGAHAEVSKVKDSTGTIYAQKIMRVTASRPRSWVEKKFSNEVAIMHKLRHHHIASVQFTAFDEVRDVYSMIMLPVADYDLLRFLTSECIDKGFPNSKLCHLTPWFGCLLSALVFAHNAKIKHEDIKPRNILIKDHQPYLADFGCAHDFSQLEDSTSPDELKYGTPVYLAPDSPDTSGRKVDVFSLGCVFSEMLTVRQRKTLEDYQQRRYLKHIRNGYAFRNNLPGVYQWLDELCNPADTVGQLLIEQTKLMLAEDERDRPKSKAVKRSLRTAGGDIVFCNSCQ